MDVNKLELAQIHGFDAAQLREAETEIRREMANLRMDIYSAPASGIGKKRNLKRSLARVLTVKNEMVKKAQAAN